MSRKEKLMILLIIFEFIVACVFCGIYLCLPKKNPLSVIFFILVVLMSSLTVITIYASGMTDKVKKVVKKVAEIVFSVTIGALMRVLDALLNMTTGTKTGNLKVITGYEDKVFSVKQKKKKRKASYKSYRLMDNREKVRFLYYKSVTKAIRKGFFFKEADTPYEVNDKLISRKYLKKTDRSLSEIYNVGRYDSESNITDEMVDMMKESC